MSEVIAHLHTTRSVHPEVDGQAQLKAALGGLVEATGLAGQEWWMLAEQTDGYVVARKPAGGEFTFTGTTDLEPERLFDGRLFSRGVEIRFARVEDVLTAWTHRALAEDIDRVPDWVRPFVTPEESRVLTNGPDGKYERDVSGLTLIKRGNGQRVVIPVPYEDGVRDIRLVMRRYFTWDDNTGRVWVSYEAPDRYERG